MGGILSYLWGSGEPKKTYTMVPDPATGLTDMDRDLIVSTWAMVSTKDKVKQTGVEFFVQLFTTYPELQNFFEAFKDLEISELRTSRKMKAHATSVMYALTSYVEMVDDPETLVGLIQKLAQSHVPREITTADFDKLAKVFVKFLTTALGPNNTPEIEAAWTKLFKAHNAVYAEAEKEIKSQQA